MVLGNRLPSRIILLQSGDIFRNLAFEACLYADNKRYQLNLSSEIVPPTDILLWRSNPCVVIGRFQCAWKECNMNLLRSHRWLLARRQSGGGAVFHDSGNLNISFVQPRSVLDRRKCMEFLRDTLRSEDRTVSIGERFDLWVPSKPPNENKMRMMRSKATASVYSPVVNLKLDVQDGQHLIVDGAMKWLVQLSPGSVPVVVKVPEGEETSYVDPTQFDRTLKELNSWSWIMGSSPAFELDLAEVEPQLNSLGQFFLHVSRGAVVSHLDFIPDENSKCIESLMPFIRKLSSALSGMECRRCSWHSVLDQVRAGWQFGKKQYEDDNISLVINALRVVSDRL